MDKKTTVADVAKIFPNATIEENGGTISLPTHMTAPCLRLVMPEKLPVGVNATGLLPGDFHATNIFPLCQELGTEFPVWIAAGSYTEKDNGPEFHFEDWLTAEKLLVVSRWEQTPPHMTAAGLKSPFARIYEACALMRITPPEMSGLNPVLLPIPVEVAPPFDAETGLDFWVIGKTDFYAAERQMLSDSLRQAIMLGERDSYNASTRSVCRQLLESLAEEIKHDPRLEGWELKCDDTGAKLTAKDRNGKVLTMAVFYTPSYLAGIRRSVEQGREGTLVFPES